MQKVTDQSNRMQSELMATKEKLSSLEKAKSALDQQVKDLNSRLDEDVANATKNAKREAGKLQARVSQFKNKTVCTMHTKLMCECAWLVTCMSSSL